jgi:Glutaminase
MKKIVMTLISTAILSQYAGASELTTRIVDVQLTKSGDQAMIFEEGGRVLRVKASEKKLLQALTKIKSSKQSLRIDFDQANHNLIGAQLLEQVKAESSEAEQVAAANYTPSELTLAEAKATFASMDGNTKGNSQCFNRAHGWAFDMFTQKRINSMKIFIFFTRKYIEEHNYDWWFHVSPFVYVKNETGIEERLMDRSFIKGPELVQTWTNLFIKTKIKCTVAEKFSDFHENQWATDCYLIKTSMFYRSPNDLKRLETENRQELDWNLEEVAEARKQAFRNWKDYNP